MLVWDEIGSRFFSSGVDRAVLYPNETEGIAWNGLTSVEDTTSRESKPFHIDGVKYLDTVIPGDFSGKLKAFTYPEEFEQFLGVVLIGDKIFVHDQVSRSFGLSYRTRIGNDTDGTDHGYRIHVLYNVSAIPDPIVNSTIGSSPSPAEFSFSLVGRSVSVPGYKSSSHFSFDSRKLSTEHLGAIEDALYGGFVGYPYLPAVEDLFELIGIDL